MGWFWDRKSDTDDPVSKLDPTLKEFLAEQSASQTRPRDEKPSPTAATISSKDAASNTYRSQLGWTPGVDQNHQNSNPAPNDRPAVPSESQFPDGRYAHLWKTYRPLAELEATARSEQDKMADIVASYKERKDAIQRAALENCVMEQMNERDCWEHGSWADRMNMCRGPNRNFLRCFQMQARFLNALGYLSQMRTADEDEQIQMHADKLYHEMLAREQRDADAQARGEPLPALPPLIDPESTEAALGPDSAWARARDRARELGMTGKLSDYTPEKQQQILKAVERLDGREREVELQLIAAESRARLEVSDRVAQTRREDEAARQERREQGKETFGDTLRRLWNGGS